MNKLRTQISLGLVCIILGVMIAYQFKVNSSSQDRFSTRGISEMTQELDSLTKQRDDLTAKVKEYQNQVDKYETAAAAEDSMAKQMKDELENLRTLSGLEDVHGPGIVITITPQMDVPSSTSNDGVNASPMMDYTTLLDIINELNSTNAAEAISINDERWVGRTQIRQVGNVIKINDTRVDLSGPFVIKAIGNPDVLMGTFKMPGSVIEDIPQFNVNLEKKDDITILKYNKPLEYNYIKKK